MSSDNNNYMPGPDKEPDQPCARSTPVGACVLVVDDNENDRELLRLALLEAKMDICVHTAMTGVEAVAYLDGRGEYADRRRYPWPALVLLDAEMPGMNGLEVLGWMRANERLRSLPVVMLSGSEDGTLPHAAYQLGANAFVTKPRGLEKLVEPAEELGRKWLWVDDRPKDIRGLNKQDEAAA